MLSDDSLLSYIGRKVEGAINDQDGELSTRRQKMLDYYRGQPYGNEQRGYSKVVTREGFEAVEWAMPLVIKAFTGNDKTVVFDPSSEDDVEQSEQETDYVNHLLLKKNSSFLNLYQWFKDVLMYPNGYIKAYPDEKVRRRVSRYKGLTEGQLVDLGIESDDITVLEQREYVEMMEIEDPLNQSVTAVPVTLYDVKLREIIRETKITVEAVPPEQVLVDDQVRSVDVDEASFVCHRLRKTKTELIDMGYDRDLLEKVGSDDDYKWNTETVNRLFYEDENPQDGDDEGGAMESFWLHECYLWYDHDNDGVAEYRRVVTIGGTIFENEETDYQPFVAMSTIIMSHQHAGISLLETMEDLQLITSTLLRNLLDNIYRINKPRKYVNESLLLEDGSTYDALLDAQAEIIPVRGDPHAGEKQEQMTPLVGEILPVIKELEERTATRTGIAPQLSMDPTVLQGSTMGAFMGALEKANERMELVIRIFAEGMRSLMLKVHQLSREYQDVEQMIQLRGQWVPVNPSQWRERTEMTVQVGLGFNNKAQMLQIFQQLLDMQKEAMGMNLSDPKKLYATVEKMCELVGLNVFEFFVDPSQPVGVDPQTGEPIPWQPPQPQPDPMIELTQTQLQMEAQLRQKEQAIKEQELALKHRENMAKLQREYEEAITNMRNKDANTALTLAKTASEDTRQLTDIAQLDRAFDQAVMNSGR